MQYSVNRLSTVIVLIYRKYVDCNLPGQYTGSEELQQATTSHELLLKIIRTFTILDQMPSGMC